VSLRRVRQWPAGLLPKSWSRCYESPSPRRGGPIAAICQKLGVAEATFHRWRNQYGGMKANEARRLRELERENARLKKLVGEQALDQAILK